MIEGTALIDVDITYGQGGGRIGWAEGLEVDYLAQQSSARSPGE